MCVYDQNILYMCIWSAIFKHIITHTYIQREITLRMYAVKKKKRMYVVVTSTTGFGALRPALQCPLKGIQLLLDDIVAVDGRHRVFMDDVLVCQTRACVVLLRYDLIHIYM